MKAQRATDVSRKRVEAELPKPTKIEAFRSLACLQEGKYKLLPRITVKVLHVLKEASFFANGANCRVLEFDVVDLSGLEITVKLYDREIDRHALLIQAHEVLQIGGLKPEPWPARCLPYLRNSSAVFLKGSARYQACIRRETDKEMLSLFDTFDRGEPKAAYESRIQGQLEEFQKPRDFLTMICDLKPIVDSTF